ncbi:MAG: DNA translocase FtsK 4TM domain-containing protein [Bacteroidales bacterium]|nr:DNA translocase FtsK 4TM domain-containing protein [Bacteroidales bacterium]
MGRWKIFTFWSDMEEDKKAGVKFVVGCVAGVFAVFTAIAIVSYMLTWQADQSLMRSNHLMDPDSGVHNSGGKLGLKWGYFLVDESFGLSSVVLLVFLSALAVRLLMHRRDIPLMKTLLYTVTGTFIGSWILAYVSPYLGLEYAFGGGLGGACGASVVAWMINLVGLIVTGIVIAALACLWLFFVSPRFSRWVVTLGEKKEEAAEEMSAEEAYDEAYELELPEQDDNPAGEEEVEIDEEMDVQEILSPEQNSEDVAEENESLEVITDDTLDAKVKKELPRINNRDDLPDFKFPPLDLLGDYESSRREVSKEELERNNNKIRATLANYKIQVEEVKAVVGPTVTLYKVKPAPGVKISTIKNLQEDIAMSLNARGVRVVNLPDCVGIEVANDSPSIVPLKSLLNDDSFRNSKAELPVAIGYTITQNVKVFDLADAPHLLVAGATKQGKSVGLNVIVSSLLYAKHPSELKFVFIDPKMVEFSSYALLHQHYLAELPTSLNEAEEKDKAIVKNAKDAAAILKSLCVEMDARYELLSKALVNNIKLYNEKYKDRHLLPTDGHRFLPYIVVVVDEYADLTMSVGAGAESKALARSITTSVIRLAQKGRAAGLHVILATQRPTVDVVTGLIKTNFPMRIAFRVTSRVDSATILDSPGADKLIGKGDMLLYSGIDMERVQCAFISNDEIRSITSFIGDQVGYKKSYNTPYYLPEPEPETGEDSGSVDMSNLDDRFEEAARTIVQYQRGSTSDLQRKLGMGYAKAGRVMDQLEAAGIVGPQVGSKPREVLVKDFAELDEILSHYMNK